MGPLKRFISYVASHSTLMTQKYAKDHKGDLVHQDTDSAALHSHSYLKDQQDLDPKVAEKIAFELSHKAKVTKLITFDEKTGTLVLDHPNASDEEIYKILLSIDLKKRLLTKIFIFNNSNTITNLKFLKDGLFPNLEKVNISVGCKLEDISGLADLKKLTHVNLSHCKAIKKLDGLEKVHLVELVLLGCSHLYNLGSLPPTLLTLNISTCYSLKDFSPLIALPNLQKLQATHLLDLKAADLEKLNKLNHLDVSYTRIKESELAYKKIATLLTVQSE